MGRLGHDLDGDNVTHAAMWVRCAGFGLWVIWVNCHASCKRLTPFARAGDVGAVETVHHTVYNIYLYYSYLIIK